MGKSKRVISICKKMILLCVCQNVFHREAVLHNFDSGFVWVDTNAARATEENPVATTVPDLHFYMQDIRECSKLIARKKN